MNQDSSFPPILPPSTELGALLFAVLPCLQECYRPLASFAYHMTELTKLKNIPSVPNLSGISGIDALITDKDNMLRSLSFYGKMFRMPLLSTLANLLQALQFYQTYKDMIPGLLSAFGGGTEASASPDLFSMLGGLSPDILSSFFGGSSTPSGSNTSPTSEQTQPASDIPPANESKQAPSDAASAAEGEATAAGNAPPADAKDTTADAPVAESIGADTPVTATESGNELFDSLYSFLTPEQKEIYDRLMHTD